MLREFLNFIRNPSRAIALIIVAFFSQSYTLRKTTRDFYDEPTKLNLKDGKRVVLQKTDTNEHSISLFSKDLLIWKRHYMAAITWLENMLLFLLLLKNP